MARTIKSDWPRNFRIMGSEYTETIKAYNVAEAKAKFTTMFGDKVLSWVELNELGQAIYCGPILHKIAKQFGFRYWSGMIEIRDDSTQDKANELVTWLNDRGYEFKQYRGNGRTAPLNTTYLEFRMW